MMEAEVGDIDHVALQHGVEIKVIKKEEDEDYLYGGTFTPGEHLHPGQQHEDFLNIIVKEEEDPAEGDRVRNTSAGPVSPLNPQQEDVVKTIIKEDPGEEDDHELDDDFCCYLCPFSCSAQIYLYKHMKSFHSNNNKTLMKAEEGESKDPSALQTPSDALSTNASLEQNHLCTFCGQSFRWQSDLKVHQLVHNVAKPYSCPQCGKSFQKHCLLRTHQRIHTGERPYRCPQCGKCFVRDCHLKNHQRVHTGERPHRCAVCKKGFCQRFHLKRHQRIHTGEGALSCSPSGGQSPVGHAGERPYLCAQCGRSFQRHCLLKRHQRIHTGERPFRCPQCTKAFMRVCHLKIHQRVHTGERPYQCPECGRRFYRQSHLKRHRLIHAGERRHAPAHGEGHPGH